MLSRLRAFLNASCRRGRFERGMADELRFHIDTHAEDLLRSGVPRRKRCGARARRSAPSRGSRKSAVKAVACVSSTSSGRICATACG
jgi:hypothetical protein